MIRVIPKFRRLMILIRPKELLWSLFGGSPYTVCSIAVDLLRGGVELDSIYDRLRAEDYPHRVAVRVVAFIPSAFVRVHYQGSGLEFPACFFIGKNGVSNSRPFRYSEEPVFNAATQLALAMHRDGDAALVSRIAEISAEQHGINSARAAGLVPKAVTATIHDL